MLALYDATVVFGDNDRSVPALRGVRFEAPKGQWTAVVGRNGSGKSTLLLALAGMVPLQEGVLTVDGRPAGDPQETVAKAVRLVTSRPEHQIVGATPREDIAFGLQNMGLPRPEIERRVRSALQAFDLEPVADVPVHRLSGGQLQRLALAGAWAAKPEWILLDEPTAMLDPDHQDQVLRLLDGLRRSGTGIIHTTHFLEEIDWADAVYLMEAGQVFPLGSPAEIRIQWERLESAGFPKPWKWRIADAVRLAGVNRPVDGRTPWSALAAHLAGADLIDGPPETSAPQAPPDTPAAGPEPLGPSSRRSGARDSGPPVAAIRKLEVGQGRLHVGECDIRAGLTAVLGASGAGKSTFLYTLLGLMPSVRGVYAAFGGEPYRSREALARLRAHAAMALQFPEQQFFAPTVYDDIAYPLLRRNLDPREVDRRVRETADMLEIESLLNRSPFSLSFGEQRRAALAGVLALEPTLAALDEPFAGLDPAGRAHLAGLIREWATEHGAAVLVATHHIDELLEFADEWMVIHRSRLAARGSLADCAAAFRPWASEDPEGWARLILAAAGRRTAVPAPPGPSPPAGAANRKEGGEHP
ncbi:MAG: energy-coupling factor transporter ATPase [Alicyclobacillaceae bacterium]|nr:energy-coupling factor transporter ATPase [Alicyclobacillaceae bacterium]